MIKAVGPARPSVRQTVITGAFIFLPHLFFVFFFFFLGGFSTQTLRHCNADLGRNVRAVAATADDRVRLDRNLHPFDRFRLRFSFLFFFTRSRARAKRTKQQKKIRRRGSRFPAPPSHLGGRWPGLASFFRSLCAVISCHCDR